MRSFPPERSGDLMTVPEYPISGHGPVEPGRSETALVPSSNIGLEAPERIG